MREREREREDDFRAEKKSVKRNKKPAKKHNAEQWHNETFSGWPLTGLGPDRTGAKETLP